MKPLPRWREGWGPLAYRGNTWLKQLSPSPPQGWVEGAQEVGVETNQLRGSRVGKGGVYEGDPGFAQYSLQPSRDSPSIPPLTLTLPHLVGKRVRKRLQSWVQDEHAGRIKDTLRGYLKGKSSPRDFLQCEAPRNTQEHLASVRATMQPDAVPHSILLHPLLGLPPTS